MTAWHVCADQVTPRLQPQQHWMYISWDVDFKFIQFVCLLRNSDTIRKSLSSFHKSYEQLLVSHGTWSQPNRPPVKLQQLLHRTSIFQFFSRTKNFPVLGGQLHDLACNYYTTVLHVLEYRKNFVSCVRRGVGRGSFFQSRPAKIRTRPTGRSLLKEKIQTWHISESLSIKIDTEAHNS